MNFFSFFATCIRRNLLEYNNSDINEKKKNGKMKSRRRVKYGTDSLLSEFVKWWHWWWIFTTWYEFSNIWVIYIYIILLNEHKSREKINTYLGIHVEFQKNRRSFISFFPYVCSVYTCVFIYYKIYRYIIIFIYMLAYSFV